MLLEELELTLQYHDELNPKLWQNEDELSPKVRDHLLMIADAWGKFADIPKGAIVDIS